MRAVLLRRAMTFVSSFRPHKDNAEYRINQCRAIASWRNQADTIILFGNKEPDLDVANAMFVASSGQWPTIREMVRMCATCDDECCIVNADIVITVEFRMALQAWKTARGMSATSRRYEYQPDAYPESIRKAKVIDNGFDFFMAKKHVWHNAAMHCPEKMWIGHCRWDNWMLGFFSLTTRRSFFDLTRFRFVFHPKHEGRCQPNRVEIDDPFVNHHGWGRRL